MTITAHDVDEAARRLASVISETPLQLNRRLSEIYDAEIWLKREDLQPVRSYKIRGAYNLISQLNPAERRHGVICASAGNHGQGVALACATLQIPGKIFVPTTTPRQKRQRMEKIGGDYIELIITGETYDDAAASAKVAAEHSAAVLVPAFDDPRTMAGQGTVLTEIVGQLGRVPDVVLTPVGGGGLLAGCLVWGAERHPSIDIVGVEPAGAACMAAALDAGRPRDLKRLDTFVDGAAVKRAGELTFAVTDRFRPRMLTVPEGRICSEMLAMYQVDGIIAEPAGALATAALGVFKPRRGETVVAIVSGGNNDVSRYAEIVERSLIYEGHKHYFLVNFPQEPGALRRFLDEVLGPQDDITHFEYVKRSNRETGPAIVGVELDDPRSLDDLLERMSACRMGFEQITSDSPFYRMIV